MTIPLLESRPRREGAIGAVTSIGIEMAAELAQNGGRFCFDYVKLLKAGGTGFVTGIAGGWVVKGAFKLLRAMRGLDEVATATRIFYRGTSKLAATEIVENQAVDVARIMEHQAQAGAQRAGVFLTSQLETAEHFASIPYGKGQVLGPAVVKIEVPAAQFVQFVEENGIKLEQAISGMPGRTETLIPFGLMDTFNAMAKYSLVP